MAVTTYGVTAAMVADACPVDVGTFTATSYVSIAQVETYIEDGASKFNGLLAVGGGSTPTDDDPLQRVREGVVAYAVARVLERLAYAGSAEYRAAQQRFEARYAEYAGRPDALTGSGRQVRTNVPVADRRTRPNNVRTFDKNYQW